MMMPLCNGVEVQSQTQQGGSKEKVVWFHGLSACTNHHEAPSKFKQVMFILAQFRLCNRVQLITSTGCLIVHAKGLAPLGLAICGGIVPWLGQGTDALTTHVCLPPPTDSSSPHFSPSPLDPLLGLLPSEGSLSVPAGTSSVCAICYGPGQSGSLQSEARFSLTFSTASLVMLPLHGSDSGFPSHRLCCSPTPLPFVVPPFWQ